jgi:hypothetical protein
MRGSSKIQGRPLVDQVSVFFRPVELGDPPWVIGPPSHAVRLDFALVYPLCVMARDEPHAGTQPAKGEPVKIPEPKKADVMAALRKVAKADEPRGKD